MQKVLLTTRTAGREPYMMYAQMTEANKQEERIRLLLPLGVYYTRTYTCPNGWALLYHGDDKYGAASFVVPIGGKRREGQMLRATKANGTTTRKWLWGNNLPI